MNEGIRVYLDNASTTPIDSEVLLNMTKNLSKNYGNPSSLHLEGRLSKKLINQSRQAIARVINADAKEIIFTSGGTESDNLAILGIARANKHSGRHIITSKIEHKAIIDACKVLEQEGFSVTYLDVDKNGLISINALKSSIKPDTILVSIMYANNEIGSIQPIKEIAGVLKKMDSQKPIFHTDACQAAVSLDIDVTKLGVDSMTISSSKIYGPKGVGCLYVKNGIKIAPQIVGGGQEGGLRSGTENSALIGGFADALTLANKKRVNDNQKIVELRDYFMNEILSKIKNVYINGGMEYRLPNNLNLSIKGVEGESLILMMDHYGIACSTGSACSSSDLNPSHVLMALKIPIDLAHCSVRFTLGRYTTKQEIDYTIKTLVKCVARIRSMSSIL